jgi:hypothetical protein
MKIDRAIRLATLLALLVVIYILLTVPSRYEYTIENSMGGLFMPGRNQEPIALDGPNLLVRKRMMVTLPGTTIRARHYLRERGQQVWPRCAHDCLESMGYVVVEQAITVGKTAMPPDCDIKPSDKPTLNLWTIPHREPRTPCCSCAPIRRLGRIQPGDRHEASGVLSLTACHRKSSGFRILHSWRSLNPLPD